MRILLIKTSSLGDIIHNLPVASDIARHLPEAQIDWVVEENFADVPRLHPAVQRVIPVAIRRWRKALLKQATWQEIKAMRELVRGVHYDAVIDTQGLIKSAWLARKARGVKHGMDNASAREPLAARFYDVRHPVARAEHAVTRNRLLAAAALGYTLTGAADYGLAQAEIAVSPAPTCGKSGVTEGVPVPFVTLLTATSRDDKLWPEAHWVALGDWLQQQGFAAQLPAGSARERERAERIAGQIPGATVAPPSSITQLAAAMQPAACVIGVDTGLVHLAAALGRPTVALYCASVPALTGVMPDVRCPNGALNLGEAGAPPSVAQTIAAVSRLLPQLRQPPT
jgi:heptosyltransferase-1